MQTLNTEISDERTDRETFKLPPKQSPDSAYGAMKPSFSIVYATAWCRVKYRDSRRMRIQHISSCRLPQQTRCRVRFGTSRARPAVFDAVFARRPRDGWTIESRVWRRFPPPPAPKVNTADSRGVAHRGDDSKRSAGRFGDRGRSAPMSLDEVAARGEPVCAVTQRVVTAFGDRRPDPPSPVGVKPNDTPRHLRIGGPPDAKRSALIIFRSGQPSSRYKLHCSQKPPLCNLRPDEPELPA